MKYFSVCVRFCPWPEPWRDVIDNKIKINFARPETDKTRTIASLPVRSSVEEIPLQNPRKPQSMAEYILLTARMFDFRWISTDYFSPPVRASDGQFWGSHSSTNHRAWRHSEANLQSFLTTSVHTQLAFNCIFCSKTIYLLSTKLIFSQTFDHLFVFEQYVQLLKKTTDLLPVSAMWLNVGRPPQYVLFCVFCQLFWIIVWLYEICRVLYMFANTKQRFLNLCRDARV